MYVFVCVEFLRICIVFQIFLETNKFIANKMSLCGSCIKYTEVFHFNALFSGVKLHQSRGEASPGGVTH